MKVNTATYNLIRSFESCSLTAYRDPAGVWTIGWGHTSAAGDPKVTIGMKITQEYADMLFQRDVDNVAYMVTNLLKNDPTENEYGAMVSLAYNVGIENFSISQVLAKFNAGNIEQAAEGFSHFIKANGVILSGLVRRRQAEQKLFLTPDQEPAILDNTVATEEDNTMWKKILWGAGRTALSAVAGAFGVSPIVDAIVNGATAGDYGKIAVAVAGLFAALWGSYANKVNAAVDAQVAAHVAAQTGSASAGKAAAEVPQAPVSEAVSAKVMTNITNAK